MRRESSLAQAREARQRNLGSARGSRAGEGGPPSRTLFVRLLFVRVVSESRFGEPPKPARQRRALPRGCGRHGRRYNKTPRQSETATIHAGTSRTLPSFQIIIGNPWRRSSMRFFRVARRWAWDATRAHFGISFSEIGFSPLGRFFISAQFYRGISRRRNSAPDMVAMASRNCAAAASIAWSLFVESSRIAMRRPRRFAHRRGLGRQ